VVPSKQSPGSEPVVRRGDELECEIEKLDSSGEGQARIDDYLIFVRDALPGERVRVRVESTGRRFARASVLERFESSPDRVEARCAHFGACGGCDLQTLRYAEQLRFKQQRTQQLLEEALGMAPELAEIAAPEEPWEQRNKLTLHFSEKGGALRLGLFRPHTRKVFGMEECPVQHPRAVEAMRRAAKGLAHSGLRVHRHADDGVLRALVVRSARSSDSVHLILVTSSPRLPGIDAMHRELDGFERLGLSLMVSTGADPSDLDGTHYHLSGPERLEEEIGGLRYLSSPTAFFQTSPWGAEHLVSRVGALIDTPEDQEIIDLYCGGGLLGLAVADRVKRVVGVELSTEAVADAKASAALNGIQNVSFRQSAAESLVRDFRFMGKPDTVLLDPPRSGLDDSVLPGVAQQLAPRRILYVSCNPSVLAKDLSILRTHGYHCLRVEPFDMFPHTQHLEALALCERRH
jgi:23S rRNA (uracil1939-C5)-methyltransferase